MNTSDTDTATAAKGLTREQRLTLLRWLRDDSISLNELRELGNQPSRTIGEIYTEVIRLNKALPKHTRLVKFMWSYFAECYTASDIAERVSKYNPMTATDAAQVWELVRPSDHAQRHTEQLREFMNGIINFSL